GSPASHRRSRRARSEAKEVESNRTANLVLTERIEPALITYIRARAVLQTMYTDPLGNVWTHLTSGGYPVGQIDPLGDRQTYLYASNRLQSAQNALGFITTHTYDGNGLLTGTQDSLGNWVTYTRDAFDNLLAVQNQLG